jgi:4-hydroxy-3-polyprenylbenzoate decarboxylase
LRHLRDHIGIKGILHVHMHMPLIGGYRVLVLRFARGTPQTEVWRALYASVTVQRPSGKFVIAVDEDIDPNNADAILWAMTFRAKPHLDMQILPHREEGHGPRDKVRGSEDSSLLVNATLRQDYPPLSLPKREYMERARSIWRMSSSFRSSSRRRRGMAMTSVPGPRSSSIRPNSPCAVIIGRRDGSSRSGDAAMSR